MSLLKKKKKKRTTMYRKPTKKVTLLLNKVESIRQIDTIIVDKLQPARPTHINKEGNK